MFLLILIGSLTSSAAGLLFTFQYVSINTASIVAMAGHCITLHSNMFLLILMLLVMPANLVLPLHSNMFLLILVQQSESNTTPFFTFQYVSINTINLINRLPGVSVFTFQYVSINTTANLLL